MIAGRVDEALTATREALEMQSEDPVTKNLLAFVNDIREGRRARPTRFP